MLVCGCWKAGQPRIFFADPPSMEEALLATGAD
jgi:hypothetical protein